MKKVLVVSHDAGGAEVLSSWLLQYECSYEAILEGPARKIFSRKNLKISNLSFQEAILNVDFVITSTSWQSDLEKEVIRYSKKIGKYVISVLDHWVNYEERFLINGEMILPNEVWTLDKHAYSIAKNLFKDTLVKLEKNYYFQNIQDLLNKKFKSFTKKNEFIGLFIGENISDHALKTYLDKDHFGYDENEALEFLLENLSNININLKSIKIRPHPSEENYKYNWALENKIISKISNSKELLDDILHSDIVFGCDSMAMVIGLMAGKKVISCIPENGRDCSLPFKEIQHLKNIIIKNI